jgi:hypothetical protein
MKKPPSKNKETLASFVAYCREHPEQRFWQALRNWAGVAFVLVSGELPGPGQLDTFYREGK